MLLVCHVIKQDHMIKGSSIKGQAYDYNDYNVIKGSSILL